VADHARRDRDALALLPAAASLPVLLIGALQWLTPSLVPPTTPFGVRIPGSSPHPEL
jgi:hypothetical protein